MWPSISTTRNVGIGVQSETCIKVCNGKWPKCPSVGIGYINYSLFIQIQNIMRPLTVLVCVFRVGPLVRIARSCSWDPWLVLGRQGGQPEVRPAMGKWDSAPRNHDLGAGVPPASSQPAPWHWLQALGLKSFKSLLKRFLKHQMAFKNQYFDDLSARESETYGSNCPQIIHTF